MPVCAVVSLAVIGCLAVHTTMAAPSRNALGGFAGDRDEPVRTLPMHGERRHRLSAGDAARQAQQANSGGRVLSIAHTPRGYRVKLIKNGEVRIIFIPAN